jgi:hypothetical protein
MRAAVSCPLALLAVSALLAASLASADAPSDKPRPKASSFAPHPASHGRTYGVPIQPRILKSHPKKKPQLTSSRLPDS